MLVGVSVVTAVRVAQGLERRRRRRAAAAVPTTTIAAAPEGQWVRVVGTVVDGPDLLRAPLTGRRCAGFVASVHERPGAAQPWRVRIEVRDQRTLVITDGTGRAVVDLTTAQLELEVSLRVGRPPPTDPAVVKLAELAPQLGPVMSEVRTREYALEVGAELAVTAVAVREPDPEAARDVTGYRGAAPTRLRLGGQRGQPAFVTDDLQAVARRGAAR